MINIKKLLEEDVYYKKILEAAPESQKELIQKYLDEFINQWQNQFFTPMENKIKNDPEFKENVKKELEKKL